MAPGDVHELRIPKAGRFGTISGYFNDPGKLADAALRFDGRVPGIYITLNPCKPELIARAANRLREYVQITTTDEQILRRQFVLIDCDPVRPTGISSTDAQHDRAITVARSVWDYLRSNGYPDPVLADSGNGAHLLQPVDLPNNAAALNGVKSLLAVLQAECGTDDIKIDLTMSNAARITKLYGSMACKGDNLPEWPHRRSRILE